MSSFLFFFCSWIRFATPPLSIKYIILHCWMHLLDYSWKWFSPHLLAFWVAPNMFGKRVLLFGVCGFGLSEYSWSCSWTWRNLEHGLRGCLINTVMEFGTERDLRDHLIQPFQTDAETPEPKGVKWPSRGLRISCGKSQAKFQTSLSRVTPFPWLYMQTLIFGLLWLNLINGMSVCKLWKGF